MEIKVEELYKLLNSDEKLFDLEFEKLLKKNIILFEQQENSKKCKKIGTYYISTLFIDDDEIGFGFSDEEHDRVYLTKNDIITVL